ncbi:cupin domain-containing protein [Nocardioides agariphilus]|uniref:Cupin domain-containing protein n=1 Tax=Nocardioides agariphilus TaxID=433664 RepID=A0A930VPF5_9ACTN|nr:cupin domain-containing protein [Nocardioides agariphilus]MBF4769396.1 cupin domain-containing protein [Nocardioides agariphilus]
MNATSTDTDQSAQLDTLQPWKQDHSQYPDVVKRLVYQNMEDSRADSLPHVLDQLPMKPTVQGMDSPHQAGDHISYEMLTRAPHYLLTSHFTGIAPKAPVRGIHRHISAPTLFCLEGRGWESNDGVIYNFDMHDLLIVPPYTAHQHGGDEDEYALIYVPETGRVHHLMGLVWREQIKLNEKPSFPQGTKGLYKDGQLIGYRIEKGVLGITEDLDVLLGSEPKREATFNARREAPPWEGEVANTYDKYLKLMHDEAQFCREVDHVVRAKLTPWEMSRHGKIRWYVHPDTVTASKQKWIYMQEIPAGSRSGRHRHVPEELIYVVQGEGYDIHDGKRWDWKAGQMICVPTMTDHQHFSTGSEPAILLSTMPAHYTFLGLGGIEQIENAPEWEEELDD